MFSVVKTTGRRIREAYESLGWNRSEFGRAIGTDLATIALWEKDEKEPQIGSLKKVAAATGRTVSWLLGETEVVSDDAAPPLVAEYFRKLREAKIAFDPRDEESLMSARFKGGPLRISSVDDVQALHEFAEKERKRKERGAAMATKPVKKR
jgi:transcriptional regulator with XRE-family HTH domain